MITFSIDPGAKPYVTIWDKGKIIDEVYLKSNVKKTLEERSLALWVQLEALYEEYKPTTLAIENILPSTRSLKSKDAVYWLVFSYGLSITLACQYQVKTLFQIIPTELKKRATGSGRADKAAMVNAANKKLKLKMKKSEHNRADSYLIGLASLGKI